MVWVWQDTISYAFHDAGGYVESRHLLWGLLSRRNVATLVLRDLGVDVAAPRPAAVFPRPGFPGDPLNLHPVDETLAMPPEIRLSDDVRAVLAIAEEGPADGPGEGRRADRTRTGTPSG